MMRIWTRHLSVATAQPQAAPSRPSPSPKTPFRSGFCRLSFLSALAFVGLATTSCGGSGDGSEPARLYCATDQTDSEVIVRRFEKETGLDIEERYDTEANKTVGLVNAILAERENPRASVFWNNELIHTIRLERFGLLEPYESPAAKNIPAQFKSPNHTYTGFGARARILIVNAEKLPNPEDRPKSIYDLIDPKWKGKGAMARPLTGTTLTHVAALFASIGEEETWKFLKALKENDVVLTGGNAQVMKMVASDDPDAPVFGLTDTDDFRKAEIRNNPKVVAIYPDQEGMGTMVIPNTVALIKGGPNPEMAKKFIDFLLSEAIESELAHGRAAQIPVRKSVKRPAHVRSAEDFEVMSWDPAKTADALEKYQPQLAEFFGQ
jgi:iron(III) transport system substrate-binding protein